MCSSSWIIPSHPQLPPPAESWLGFSFFHSTDSYLDPTMCQGFGWTAGVWVTGRLRHSTNHCPKISQLVHMKMDLVIFKYVVCQNRVFCFGGKNLLCPSHLASLFLANMTAIEAWASCLKQPWETSRRPLWGFPNFRISCCLSPVPWVVLSVGRPGF